MGAQLNAYAAVLAGGIGSRFWPASTPARPKQFLPLASPTPLIAETLDRAVRLVGADRVRVVTSAHFAGLMSDVLDRFGTAVLVEPQARGTAPALAWAAREIEAASPGAVMISMHADHRIEPFDGLRETLDVAVRRAGEGELCCIGVRPDRPEAGYGYIELGDALGDGTFRIDRFVEKPDETMAAEYVASGRHLWNTGIFIWRAADLLDAIDAHAVELADAMPALRSGAIEAFFDRARPVAIDVAVMERAANRVAVEARFEWDDLGVWNAVARSRGTDAEGNAVVGSARLRESRDNVVWTENTRATLIGVRDLVVVEANGEILVIPRELAPRLGTILESMDMEENA